MTHAIWKVYPALQSVACVCRRNNSRTTVNKVFLTLMQMYTQATDIWRQIPLYSQKWYFIIHVPTLQGRHTHGTGWSENSNFCVYPVACVYPRHYLFWNLDGLPCYIPLIPIMLIIHISIPDNNLSNNKSNNSFNSQQLRQILQTY